MYKVLWSHGARDALGQMPVNIAELILWKVDTHLAQSPDMLGKPLRSKLRGLYRYRIGDYRVIYKIDRDVVEILVTKVAHRSIIYEE